MSERKKQNPSAKLSDIQTEYLDEFSRGAATLINAYADSVNLHANPSARRSAFAAQEAVRSESQKRVHDVAYFAFVLLSVLAALIIGFAVPQEFKSLVWDTWGLVSTLLLLAFTYGIYVFLIFCQEVKRAMRPGQVPIESQKATAGHTVFTILGGIFAWNAGGTLHSILIVKQLQVVDAISCNRFYMWFIFWVCCLAILFVVMDYWVAVMDDSHNETFIAASSFVHSTIPMAIGVMGIGLYMLCDYFSFIHQGKNGAQALVQLPVEFASGALSFQMIMSNTLFAFIKRNVFLRFAYFATGSTKLP